MPLRMSLRETFGGERMWAFGAGERWSGSRPIRRPGTTQLPTRTVVPDELRRPRSYRRTDERIREDVCERLWDDAHVDVGDVSVEVRDGIVTLEGTVPHRPMKYRVEDMAADVSGVRDVENRIRVHRDRMRMTSG